MRKGRVPDRLYTPLVIVAVVGFVASILYRLWWLSILTAVLATALSLWKKERSSWL